ncbi:hypothetical protein A3L02_04300 [Thermococcus celer Vu 13 = JCM 8558]|uniref:Uncharacterized protein n=1 Tax=Thermococcus celer Vu 13 = JCM 8558 TaxID=1293037 RepID=A0A218P1M6_THECE|nr:hypothetical protein A3L02_04300 [Thermococcus celer Vu 13 = JCM 8558]
MGFEFTLLKKAFMMGFAFGWRSFGAREIANPLDLAFLILNSGFNGRLRVQTLTGGQLKGITIFRQPFPKRLQGALRAPE